MLIKNLRIHKKLLLNYFFNEKDMARVYWLQLVCIWNTEMEHRKFATSSMGQICSIHRETRWSEKYFGPNKKSEVSAGFRILLQVLEKQCQSSRNRNDYLDSVQAFDKRLWCNLALNDIFWLKMRTQLLLNVFNLNITSNYNWWKENFKYSQKWVKKLLDLY